MPLREIKLNELIELYEKEARIEEMLSDIADKLNVEAGQATQRYNNQAEKDSLLLEAIDKNRALAGAIVEALSQI